MKNSSITFGHKLQSLRGARVVTQRELARRMNMDTAHLSRLENNIGHLASTETVLKIARALDLSQEESDHLFVLAGKIPPDVMEKLIKRPALLGNVRKSNRKQKR